MTTRKRMYGTYMLAAYAYLITAARDNVAYNKTATQSSTLYYGNPVDFYWMANLATDGHKSNRLNIDWNPVCSATYQQDNPWWRVDLGQELLIEKIIIYGRLQKAEHLRGFDLYITSADPDQLPDSDLVYSDTIEESEYKIRNGVYAILTHHRGQFVHIVLPKTRAFLVLCEVEVYEVCPPQFYGSECTSVCGKCKSQDICNSVTGKCPDGCEPGLLPDKCTKECPDGSFGDGCALNCGECKSDLPCDKATGQCDACAAGYKGFACFEKCDDFTYGEECQQSCGQCKDDLPCNHETGYCQRCKPGFTGRRCKRECEDGWYGENCVQSCGHCINSSICDKVSGKCSACAPGYMGEKCIKECEPYKYGENCSYNCGQCWYGTCDHKTGLCSSCKDGYNTTDMFCKTECDDGHWGYKCKHKCGACKDGELCNKTNGYCLSGCSSGYQGKTCREECSGNTFGDNCKSICHCHDNKACNISTGVCPDGLCSFEWTGYNCQTDLNLIRRLGQENVTTNMSTPMWGNTNSTLAIDGDATPDPNACHCCSVSVASHPWWTIDLHQMYPIRRLIFVGRSGGYFSQYSKFRVYLSNSSDTFGDAVFTYRSSYDYSSSKNHIVKLYLQNILTRFVKIDRDTSILTICELKLYEGACWIGRFGDECRYECHCADKRPCDKVNGQCQAAGCIIGWQGESCNKECDYGTFGANCSEECHCLDNSQCNKVNGTCGLSSCAPGWLEYNCGTACEPGRFGINCSSECHCQVNVTCNHVSGSCKNNACESGYEGKNCSVEVSSQRKYDPEPPSDLNTAGVVAGICALLLVLALGVGLVFRIKSKDRVKVIDTHIESTLPAALNGCVTTDIDLNQETRYYQVDPIRRLCLLCEVDPDEVDADYYNINHRQTDINVHELWDYINTHKMNRGEYFANEFMTVNKCLGLWTVAKRPENYSKNRYKDMYAYDHSRVVLKETDAKGSDYINACYINGYEKEKKFIAAQGPTETTVNDFWSMVWQENVSIIVMLTNLIEMGHMKCLQYWPDNECESVYGDITIRVKDQTETNDFKIRTIEATKFEENTRIIQQYHFKAWPDKNVPDSAWSLVRFWQAINENILSNGGPIVVHCSAGVGRTGTFIGLDILYQQSRTEKCLHPLETLKNLRMQRVNMIQTKDQYIFLHEAVAEALYMGTHSIFLNQFEDVYGYLCEDDKDKGECRLALQYELLVKSITAAISCHKDKEQTTQTESIYSNADSEEQEKASGCDDTFAPFIVKAFNDKNCFIFYKTPVKMDLNKYLQLIKLRNINCIVNLSDQSETYSKDCARSNAVLLTKNGSETPKQSTVSDENVREFTILQWQENAQIPDDEESFFQVLDSVQNWQQHLDEANPILIQTKSNLAKCTTVCVLLNELYRIRIDGAVNILESMKKVIGINQELIPSFEQYAFCYEAIRQLFRQSEVYANI